MRRDFFLVGFVLVALIFSSSVYAFDFDLHGSLGEGENKFKRYVPPVSNPVLNETPYITTEVRPMYLHQNIPFEFLTQGGSIDLLALQLRVAINDRLGIIANKDGYADIDFDSVLPDDDGFANIALGLKYAIYNDPKNESILTTGLTYEAPSGSLRSGGIRLQGNGDGFLRWFVSGATMYKKLAMQSSFGFNVALDQDHDSSMFYMSGHLDYELCKKFFPLLEFNMYRTIGNAERTPVDLEGSDLVNLGTIDSGTVLTIAGGFRYHIIDHVQMGFTYEAPLTNREDLLDWRTTLDFVFYY